MNLNFRLILLYTVLLFTSSLSAQTGNSPYSVIGIGDMSSPGYIRNLGMGGTGTSNGNPEFINIQNPALLPINRFHNLDSTTKFTMLEAGFSGQVRDLRTSTASATTNGFNINYFSFAFPISQRWTTSIGLRPFSNIQNRYITNLNNQQIQDPNIINAVNDYSIKGSLNQMHFANGYDLTKNISVGLFAGYIFGNVTEQDVTQAQLGLDGSLSANTGTYTHTYYSGFEAKPGIAYRGEIKDSAGKGSGTYFNAGFTFDYIMGMHGKQDRKLVSQDPYDGIAALGDTITSSYKVTMPPVSRIGISLDKPGNWSVALDFSYSAWSYYRSTVSSYPNTQLRDSYTIALGGEIKPGIKKTLKTQEFRAGISYTKSPITINNIQIDDLSLSIGTSIPLGRKDARFKSRPLSKINAAFVVGNRGTTSNGLIREQYFSLYLGVLIHDKWFQHWRID